MMCRLVKQNSLYTEGKVFPMGIWFRIEFTVGAQQLDVPIEIKVWTCIFCRRLTVSNFFFAEISLSFVVARLGTPASSPGWRGGLLEAAAGLLRAGNGLERAPHKTRQGRRPDRFVWIAVRLVSSREGEGGVAVIRKVEVNWIALQHVHQNQTSKDVPL